LKVGFFVPEIQQLKGRRFLFTKIRAPATNI